MKYTYYIISFIFFISCKQHNKHKNELIREDFSVDTSLPIEHPKAKIVYDKLNFGNGYNSANGKEFFGVLEYEGTVKSTEISANATGNTGTISMDILESKEQLKQSLQVTTKVDLDLKIYGFTSNNSFKNDLYQETAFNDFSQNAVIKAEYTNEPLVIINPTVKKEWIALAKRNPDEFMRTCGDMFVSRIYTGGELYAFFSLQSHDSSEKEKNETFFKTVNSYYGNSLGASVDIQKVSEKFNETKQIKTKIFTKGGGATPTKTSLDDFVAYANKFKEQVAQDQRAMILYVELSPYETIAGFPEVNFNKIRVDQTNFLEYGIEKYNELEESLANAQFVKKESQYFEEYDIKTADSIINTFPEKINDIQVLLKNCESDFDQCDISILEQYDGFDIFSPQIDYPELKEIQVDLPITPNQDYTLILENTGNEGKLLSIKGMLESRPENNRSKPKCYNTNYKGDRKFYKRTRLTDTYIYLEYPYYKIRYKDVKSNAILKEVKWNGTPVETEKNAKVEVKLVNPNTKLQYYWQKKWYAAGEKREKRVNFTSKPYFTAIRQCDANTIKATFANKNKVNTLTLSNQNDKKFPTLIKKGDYWGYDFGK